MDFVVLGKAAELNVDQREAPPDVFMCLPNAAPLSIRGGGRSRMLETLAMHSAHAPLPASRLDMRACHPAEKLDQVHRKRGFHAPLPSVAGAR